MTVFEYFVFVKKKSPFSAISYYKPNAAVQVRKNLAFGYMIHEPPLVNKTFITHPHNLKSRKAPMNRISVVLLAIFILTAVALAADRVVFLERFTATTCPYCPPCGELVDLLADTLQYDLAILEIHRLDQFSVYNSADHRARRTHYSISGTPSVAVDGKKLTNWSSAAGEVFSRLETPAFLDMDIAVEDSILVTIDVQYPDSGTDNRLFVAVTQDNIYNPSASNGEIWTNHLLRDLLPDTLGQLIDISELGTQAFSFQLEWDDEVWDSAYMKIVAWVQDMSASVNSYNVFNAVWVRGPRPAYHFIYDPGILSKVIASSPDDSVSLGGGSLENMGNSEDTYSIKIIKNLCSGWNAKFCIGDSSYSDSGTVTLQPDSIATIDVHFTNMSDGMGMVDMIITSQGGGKSDTASYYASKDPNILIVDGDKGDNYERFYISSLINLGEAAKIYHSGDTVLTGNYLLYYDVVIWMIGKANTNLLTYDSDTTAFGQLLDYGGNLFMSGQSFAEYFEYLGTTVSPNFYAWFKNRTKAQFLDDDIGIRSVIGVTGGPFDGLTYSLGGGDGADNITTLDMITPFTGGASSILYNGGGYKPCAGVRSDSSLVYFAFPFEAVNTQEDRDTLMARVLLYLRDQWIPNGVANDVNKPDAPLILSIAPNPFNSATELNFELSSPGNVSLDIFDLAGRKVTNLADGTFEDGIHRFIWNGRDDTSRELSSGIYLARFTVGEKTIMKRLLLIK